MKRGFTLIELLVYMAIMGFIIVVAGRVFSDSTSMRVRSHNMLKSSEEIGKVSDLIREDISQMGVKAWWDIPNSTMKVVDKKVYVDLDAGDTSSYTLEHESEDFDKLKFKKAEFGDDGTFLGVREIEWFVKENTLYRKCRTIDGGTDDTCPDEASEAPPVLIVKNLKKFVFRPSKPGIENDIDTLFPNQGNTDAALRYTLKARSAGGGANEDLKGANVEGSSVDVISVKSDAQCIKGDENTNKHYSQVCLSPLNAASCADCSKMPLRKGETYSVHFEMPHFDKEADTTEDFSSTQFLPGFDHIAVGFRNNSGDPIDGVSNDVLFYPPQDTKAKNVKRYAEFSVKTDVDNACLAITFAFCSINGANTGKMRFKKFEVLRKTDRAFRFEKGTNIYGSESTNAPSEKEKLKEKKNVKAFELVMEIENKGEKAGTNAGENTGMIITTPNNGVFVMGSQ
jgi:prepilin-type N-terminal cleavage/methylation domain-containing protein